MKGTLPAVKTRLGVGLLELGEAAGCTASAISMKLRGMRPWKVEEAHAIAGLLASKYDVTDDVVTLFGLEDA